jgi:hypothetical protein
MRQITITGLSLQFDADQVTSGDIKDQAAQAIDLINGTLQREPYGLAAQVFQDSTKPKITASEIDPMPDDGDIDDDSEDG